MQFFAVRIFPLLLLIHIASSANCARQIVFVPPAFNYTPNGYGAGNQNWSVAQGDDGVVYVGNDYGLLSFDAVNWKLYTLPNKLSVKSIFIDNSLGEEKIYVGSFEEFGFFRKNNKNELHYHSLKHLIKDYALYNDEVWTINKMGDDIFFQTFSSYFIYNESSNSVKAFKPFPAPLYFFKVEEKLYAQFIDDHFYKYDGAQFRLLLTRDKLGNDDVVAVLPFHRELLLITSGNGLFSYNPVSGNLRRFPTNIDRELKSETINRGITLSDSTFVLGTLNNGLYALKTDGKILWRLNRDNGLYNNTVLGLFKDTDQNLWVALDNGLSFIQSLSPLSFFEPQRTRIGMAEDILITKNRLYIATNQGIYSFDEERNIFQLPGFNVQSWFLRNFDGQIITGNNTGTSFIENDRNIEISGTSTGGTDMKAVRMYNRDFLLESTYTALQVYLRNSSGKWIYSHKVADFFDLILRIEFDHSGNIWANHMYKGVYKLRLDEQLRKVVHREFYSVLDSTERPTKPVRAMKLRGRILFTNGKRFYTYDDIEQKIISFDRLNSELPNLADTQNIVAVNDTSFWFIRPEEYTLVSYESKKYRIADRIPFAILNNPPNTGRGNIYVDEKGVSYFCLNGGIGKYVYNAFAPSSQSSRPTISRMWSYNRKKDIRNNLDVSRENTIRYAENNLTFEFQYPDFSKKKFYMECFLENYDSRWTTVASDLTVSYTNLPANNYLLNVRVLNGSGIELSRFSIPFRVKNPLYKSGWAVFAYCLLIASLLLFLIGIYIRAAVKKRNKIFEQQEKERIAQLARQEKLIAEMKSEKLENELTYKSKELANASMLIISHEELMNKLKKEILENMKTGKINRFYGINLVKMIDNSLSGEDEWALFQQNFDLIHENFFRKLTDKYPALTPGDLRLCALLRLNYSSKDIAKMLNLSLRGVEAARYRLRKKLFLNEEENLHSFIINFK